ncbi:MAG: hypothetical protein J6Z34_03150, partial [Clostridia bacterium]|nr:hypothetical protein [Clostridia bacterium]
MAKDEQAKEEICINRIFPKSTYLANETNLGHEIINLYKCDNGNDYIYLMPSGDYSSTHNRKIKTILIVRGITSDCVEVIAKATDLEPFFNDEE